jgi:hypothetical protein
MRSTWRVLVVAAAAALAVPQLAMADDVEEQLRAMNERMSQLEDQLQATKDELDDSQGTIERQQALIEKADLGEEGKSGLDDFFTKIEIGGWVSASYFYNFNNPRDRNANANAGSTANDPTAALGENTWAYPFHPDHNTFSVDQVWWEIEKPVTEESRAGFRLDLVYGKTAALLEGINEDREEGGDSASAFNLYQAYIQYLMPFGNMTLKAGKFGTIVGGEVAPTVYNFNVTRGNVYNLLQPVTHYGVLIDGEAGPFTWTLGGLNSGTCSSSFVSVGNCAGGDPDWNDAKSLVAGASFGGETFSMGTTILWGVDNDPPDAGGANASVTGNSGFGETGLVDVLIQWDPTERFSTWLNFDYKWEPSAASPGVPHGPAAWGLAMAARVGLTESLGFAIRGEYLQDSNQLFGFEGGDADISGITGTFDWTITEGLVAKAEVRWDSVVINGAANNTVFAGNNGPTSDVNFNRSDQLVGGVELTYQF